MLKAAIHILSAIIKKGLLFRKYEPGKHWHKNEQFRLVNLVETMSDKEYFSHLYEIASHLNKEFSLHSALRKSLEKTVELLNLETGWILAGAGG